MNCSIASSTTLSLDQMATFGAMGDRWIEGSAEAFAAHAIVNSWQTTTVDDDGLTTVDVTGTAGRSTRRWSILWPGRLAGCTD